MEYEPKIIPEGINTSKEHPIREFFVLISVIGAAIVIIIYFLIISSDYLIQYIPVEKENEWFSSEMFEDSDDGRAASGIDVKREKVEQYLVSLVNDFKDEEHKEFKFTVNIIEDETPNAFITPGGHIFINYGLLKYLTSENALAMVIGHEMAHQYHRHTIKGLGRGIIVAMGLMILTGFDDSSLAQSFVGSTVELTGLVFSREQEREADATGVELLIKKYKHASGSTEFFKKLLEDRGGDSKMLVFLSTHPGDNERVIFLERFEREYQGDVLPLPEFVSEYVSQVERKKSGND